MTANSRFCIICRDHSKNAGVGSVHDISQIMYRTIPPILLVLRPAGITALFTPLGVLFRHYLLSSNVSLDRKTKGVISKLYRRPKEGPVSSETLQ